MECKKCHYELDEGSLFCPECGAKVDIEEAIIEPSAETEEEAAKEPQAETQEEAIIEPQAEAKEEATKEPQKETAAFCPNCGKPLEQGSAFCDSCGSRLDGKSETAAPVKKPINIKVAAGVAVVAVTIGAFAISHILGTSGGGGSKEINELIYVKDTGIYGISLKNSKQKPVEYTDNFADNDSVADAAGNIASLPMVTKDNKYHFVIEDYSWDNPNTFSLFYTDGKKDPVKIDGGIETYKVTEKNEVLYKKNGNLYLSDLKDKKKMASDISDFWFDEKENNVFWRVAGGSSSDYYYQDLALKNEKVKLISEAANVKYSNDMNTILFLKDDSVYLIKNLGEKEKLIGNVSEFYVVDVDNATFYYTKEVEMTFKRSDFVVDDLAEQDLMITEPNRADYEREEVTGSGIRTYRKTVLDDTYYEDLEKYNQKKNRDSLRSLMKETETNTTTELYYYKDDEKKQMSDYCAYILDSGSITGQSKKTNSAYKGYFIYVNIDLDNIKKIKFSELGDQATMAEIDDRLTIMMAALTTVYVCVDGEEAEVDMDFSEAIYLSGAYTDVKNNQLYVNLPDSDSDGLLLLSIDLNASSLGNVVERDEDVYSINAISDGDIYYTKDYNSDKRIGDLYKNGELIMEDVSSMRTIKDSSAVLCYVDYNTSKNSGTLMLVKKDGNVKIADDVSKSLYAINETSIAMITEYNSKRNKGDLKYYNGKETYLLDTDVSEIINQ